MQSEDLSSEAAGYIKSVVALVIVWSIIAAVVLSFMYRDRIEKCTMDFRESFHQGLRNFRIREETAPSGTLGLMRVGTNLSQTTILTLPLPIYTRPPSYASAGSLICHHASILLVDDAGYLTGQTSVATTITADDPPLSPPDLPPLRVPSAAHTRSPTPPLISTSSLHALVP